MPDGIPQFTDTQIVAARPGRNRVDPRRPYAYLAERERSAKGDVVDVATLFLTNRECPFCCLMCDLWKNTLVESVRPGDIPEQIRWALGQLPKAKAIKLYNSGNFFDRRAIPHDDHEAIAALVRRFETVVVENHPKLCDEECLRFRDRIAPAQLEIALGLETSHPQLLATLNKRMCLDDFDRALERLHAGSIRTRVFLLLSLPFLDADESLDWTLRSINYAFERGVDCCSVIPTRPGNGMLDRLQQQGDFSPPDGSLLERVLSDGLRKARGRVFVDLWDAEPLFACPVCRTRRIERLRAMNLGQTILPTIDCEHCHA
jgi:radical SAM enzyme (TIGR01210 family)